MDREREGELSIDGLVEVAPGPKRWHVPAIVPTTAAPSKRVVVQRMDTEQATPTDPGHEIIAKPDLYSPGWLVANGK